jgi:hypothetical protein
MHLAPAIFVDVDDTLVRSFGSKRIPITAMVALVRDLNDSGAALYWRVFELHPNECASLTAVEVLSRLRR